MDEQSEKRTVHYAPERGDLGVWLNTLPGRVVSVFWQGAAGTVAVTATDAGERAEMTPPHDTLNRPDEEVWREMERRWLFDPTFHAQVEQAVQAVLAKRPHESVYARNLMREAVAIALMLAAPTGNQSMCDRCGQRFPNDREMVNHQRSVHTPEGIE